MKYLCASQLNRTLIPTMTIALALVWVVNASAQTFRGTILGTVTHATGAAISGAKVTVRNQDTGTVRTTQTTADGEYRVPELPIGTYTVTVEMPAFGTAVTRDIKVDVASEVRSDVTLKPGEVATSVEVSGASLSQVETTNDTLGATLTSSTIKDVPVSGRDYTNLMFLTPGVTG